MNKILWWWWWWCNQLVEDSARVWAFQLRAIWVLQYCCLSTSNRDPKMFMHMLTCLVPEVGRLCLHHIYYSKTVFPLLTPAAGKRKSRTREFCQLQFTVISTSPLSSTFKTLGLPAAHLPDCTEKLSFYRKMPPRLPPPRRGETCLWNFWFGLDPPRVVWALLLGSFGIWWVKADHSGKAAVYFHALFLTCH